LPWIDIEDRKKMEREQRETDRDNGEKRLTICKDKEGN
jgi:hypothetical protein